MATKTITVTEDAYYALNALKRENESFSEMSIRISRRKPLGEFFGVLSKEGGERLENAIMEMRKKRAAGHKERMRRIAAAWSEE